MELVFVVVHLCNIPLILYCVAFFLLFNLVSISWTEWLMVPACPSLMCSFDRGNVEGTGSLKICVRYLCMYVLCLRGDWFCRLT